MPIPDMNNGGYSDKIAENAKEGAAMASEVMKAHAAAHVGVDVARNTAREISGEKSNYEKPSRLTQEGRAVLERELKGKLFDSQVCDDLERQFVDKLVSNRETKRKLTVEILNLQHDLSQ